MHSLSQVWKLSQLPDPPVVTSLQTTSSSNHRALLKELEIEDIDWGNIEIDNEEVTIKGTPVTPERS